LAKELAIDIKSDTDSGAHSSLPPQNLVVLDWRIYTKGRHRTQVPCEAYSRSTPCECHFASLFPMLMMYLLVLGALILANAKTNTSKHTEARTAPTVFSKPASHPDWPSQPSGFSSLLMSKKRFVPTQVVLV
jgi:hypothetical protein